MPARRKPQHTYEYPRPALTVDVVLATRELMPKVLLIRRCKQPFENAWALPGGFVDENEKLIDAAKRELYEETGLQIEIMEQLYAAGDPGRDPRGWTVSVIFLAFVSEEKLKPVASDDASDVGWFALDALPKLAFDHDMILRRAQARLIDRMP